MNKFIISSETNKYKRFDWSLICITLLIFKCLFRKGKNQKICMKKLNVAKLNVFCVIKWCYNNNVLFCIICCSHLKLFKFDSMSNFNYIISIQVSFANVCVKLTRCSSFLLLRHIIITGHISFYHIDISVTQKRSNWMLLSKLHACLFIHNNITTMKYSWTYTLVIVKNSGLFLDNK
jgi:hypothetical protein